MDNVKEIFNVTITKVPLKRKLENVFDVLFFMICILVFIGSIIKIFEFDKGWGWYILVLILAILFIVGGATQSYVSNVIVTKDDLIIEEKSIILRNDKLHRCDFSRVKEFYIDNKKIKGNVAGKEFQLLIKPEYIYLIKDVVIWINEKSKNEES